MRMRRKLVFLCAFFGTCISVGWPQTAKDPKTGIPPILRNPPDANPQYFPEGIFDDSSDSGSFKDFKARWYSTYLRAMHEPSLLEESKDGSLTAYRFLWLRTFRHPIAVRLMVRVDGTGSLSGKVTSGAGGYEAGNMTWNESVDISEAHVEQFIGFSQKAEFWTSRTRGSVGGADGAQWIMEGVHNGIYHVVDRWSPTKDDYATMCLFLLRLSKIPVNAKDVY
jgi:hypothetical protein